VRKTLVLAVVALFLSTLAAPVALLADDGTGSTPTTTTPQPPPPPDGNPGPHLA